ncbi:protein cholesin [Tautogolabrus adspersus]
MAKDKSLKPETLPPKRKKLSQDAVEVHETDMEESKVKKKRKNLKVEEAPVQIPHVTITADDEKQTKKKEKKRKKKQKAEETEISEPPGLPEGAHDVEGEEDLSPEERRVLERKMKKILKKEEKKRLKDGGVTPEKTEASGPTAPQHALDYLTCWAENRTEWKFQKTRQTWLLQHMFDSEKVPDEKFSLLLQYLEGLRGGARDTTAQKALALIESSGQEAEDRAVQQRAHRAREVIQLLT